MTAPTASKERIAHMDTRTKDASMLQPRYKWRGTNCRRTTVEESEAEKYTIRDIILGFAAVNIIAFVLAYGFLGGFNG